MRSYSILAKTSPNRFSSDSTKYLSRLFFLYRSTCRHGLLPSGRQPQTPARLNAFESKVRILIAMAGVLDVFVMNRAISAR